jgi:hypothetical protein
MMAEVVYEWRIPVSVLGMYKNAMGHMEQLAALDEITDSLHMCLMVHLCAVGAQAHDAGLAKVFPGANAAEIMTGVVKLYKRGMLKIEEDSGVYKLSVLADGS